jgi:hypothetical protein
MTPALAAVLAVLAIVGVGAAIVAVRRARTRRTDATALASQTMGFTFEEEGDFELMKSFADLPLFRNGHSRKVRNVMTGRTSGRDVKLFDYQYTTGGGEHSHTAVQTVALFPGGSGGMPDFLLAPENVFHKIGQIFGYQDIDFETSPEFSSHYLLRGRDEEAIRSAFTADALAFLRERPGWNVEAQSGTVAVYRAGRRCRPEDLRTFLTDAESLLRALTHA